MLTAYSAEFSYKLAHFQFGGFRLVIIIFFFCILSLMDEDNLEDIKIFL